MGTVFTLWVAWVTRVPNSCATGIEFNREPNFRHPAEERVVMKYIYRSNNSLLSDYPLSAMKKLTKNILYYFIYFIPVKNCTVNQSMASYSYNVITSVRKTCRLVRKFYNEKPEQSRHLQIINFNA